MERKRYWLFAGNMYYPLGGMDDFESSFDTVDEAIQAHVPTNDPSGEWAEVFDSDNMVIEKYFVRHRSSEEIEWK